MPTPDPLHQLIRRFETNLDVIVLETTKRQIDALAFVWYGLTEEEIRVVEGRAKRER